MNSTTIKKQLSDIRLNLFINICHAVSEFEKLQLVADLDTPIFFEAGFDEQDITVVEGNMSRVDLLGDIGDFTEQVKADNRVIIYLSTHGFEEKEGTYLATSDCSRANPLVGCMTMENLQTVVKYLVKKRVKHMLIILDACVTGWDSQMEQALIEASEDLGVHILLAGKPGETTHVTPREESLVAHFFKEGLVSKQADLKKDGMITFDELARYVRFNVYHETAGRQTPHWTHLAGDEEISFYVGISE